MSRRTKKELSPRHGHTLVAGVVCRVSGCESQSDVSLDDQLDHGREEVVWLYKGEVPKTVTELSQWDISDEHR